MLFSTHCPGEPEPIAGAKGEMHDPLVRLAILQTDFKVNTERNMQPKDCTHICWAVLLGKHVDYVETHVRKVTG